MNIIKILSQFTVQASYNISPKKITNEGMGPVCVCLNILFNKHVISKCLSKKHLITEYCMAHFGVVYRFVPMSVTLWNAISLNMTSRFGMQLVQT